MINLSRQTFTKAMLCSLALHLALMLAPHHSTSAMVAETTGTSELKLTLARAQMPIANEQPSTPIESNHQEPPLKEKTEATEPVASNQPKQPVVHTDNKPDKTSKALPTPRRTEPTLISQEISPPKEPAESTDPKKEKSDLPTAVANSPAKGDLGEPSDTEIPVSANQANAMTAWISDLKQRINQHKHYPRQALRRGLEGDVKIQAVIQADGELVTAEILSGDRRFKSSSLKALSQALPFPPPLGTLAPVKVSFSIHYAIDQEPAGLSRP
ncbi:MAG: TonB family protein [Endozoicomonas sp.]